MKRGMLLLTCAGLLLGAGPARACTLWAANGRAVAGGGSMIVKNRDWRPDQYEVLRLVTPSSGYRYLGLYADGQEGGTKAGINEKGLVVVSATVDSIPAARRKALPYTHGLLVKLLRSCASVDEALAKIDGWQGPRILMLADRRQVATIEVGPEGKSAVVTKHDAVIYHTNHYLAATLQDFNQRIFQSSRKRYERIGQLLDAAEKPLAFKTFLGFGNDRSAGPDDSIFRTGSTPAKPRTMATWAVRLPPAGPAEVYVKILNPGQPARVIRLDTAALFSAPRVTAARTSFDQ